RRRSVDRGNGDADAAARIGTEWLKARELGAEGALAAYGRAGIRHDLARVVLSGADDQVKNAIAVDIPHGDVDGAFKARERDDRSDEAVAVAVVQTNLGRSAGRAWNGHRINGDGGDDVD